jgi:hypothetical protein
MTRDELKAQLQVGFDSSANYEDQDYDTAIQDGYEETVAVSGCIFKSVVLPFTQNLTYYDFRTLISDFLGVVAIFNGVTKRWLFPLSMRKMDSLGTDWETLYGTPDTFIPISHRYVAITRKPAVANYGDMYVFYRATAPLLTASTDLGIPEDHIQVLQDYAFTDLLERNQEFGKASIVFKEYVEELQQFRESILNQRVPDRLPALKG